MQNTWLVALYYILLLLLCVGFRYAIDLRWWPSFILSLLITFIVIVFTGPDWTGSKNAFDMLCLILLLILVVLAPILLAVYIVAETLQDRNDRICAYRP